MKINIENLLDILTEENRTYQAYKVTEQNISKELYEGGMARLKEQHDYEYRSWTAQRDAVCAVFDVLGLDQDQIQTCYSLTRSVNRWREDTNWERFIPESMQEQIMRAVFRKPEAPSSVCAICGCWGR